jgi:hypothetical protein
MDFEEILKRWTEAEVAVAAYRLGHPGRGCPEAEFLCAQLEAVAAQWYALLLDEVARVRRQMPRL